MPDPQEIPLSAPAELSVPLLSIRRERGRWAQKLQHAIPAFILLGAGVRGLAQGERGLGLALALGELAVSFLLLRTLVKEIKEARRPHSGPAGHSHGVDWFDIFAGGVLAAEALEHWHTRHHLPRPTLLMAVAMVLIGIFHGKIAAFGNRRQALSLDAAGLGLRKRLLARRFFARWQEIERIDLDERTARIVVRDGRERRIDLADLRNAAEVRQALLAARERLAP